MSPHLCTFCCLLLRLAQRIYCSCIQGLLWITGAYRGKYQKTILLFRPDQLGDFLVSTFVFKAYFEHFHSKGYRLVLVHAKGTQELAEHLPYVDERLCAPGQSDCFWAKFRFYRILAQYRAEWAIRMPTLFGGDLNSLRWALFSGALHKASLQEKPDLTPAGMELPAIPAAPSWRQRICAHLFSKREKLLLTDAWKYQAILPLFDVKATAPSPSSIYDKEAQLASLIIRKTIPPHSLPPDYLPEDTTIPAPEKYYCLIPGSSNPARRWPPQNFAEIIYRIHQNNPQLVPIILGVQSELPFIQEILSHLPTGLPVINLGGKTNLCQVNTIISRSQFVLAHDTGTAHFAGARNIPTLLLLGGGHYGSYFPVQEYPNTQIITISDHSCFPCLWICHKLKNNSFPCVTEIPIDSVWHSMQKLITGLK